MHPLCLGGSDEGQDLARSSPSSLTGPLADWSTGVHHHGPREGVQLFFVREPRLRVRSKSTLFICLCSPKQSCGELQPIRPETLSDADCRTMAGLGSVPANDCLHLEHQAAHAHAPQPLRSSSWTGLSTP